MFRKQEDYTSEMAEELHKKLSSFYERIQGKKVVIGFTGGLKSYMLVELLRPLVTEMKCVFVQTSYTSPQDLIYVQEFKDSSDYAEIAIEIIQNIGLNQNILILNSQDRDFFCKKGITDILEQIRSTTGFDMVLDGTDKDQFQMFWNNKQQFGENYYMIGELGISREDIFFLSKKHGFKFQPHPEINLLSRFAYNFPITEESLKSIVELERYLKELTNVPLVRIRCLDKKRAIIEVRQEDLSRLLDEKTRKKILLEFNERGFVSINVDLAGYRRNNLFFIEKPNF